MADRVVRVAGSWSDVPADAWDALVGEESPFLEHEFLLTAEESGAAVPANGWAARPVTVWEGDRLVGGAPAWLKSHSMGEFVYDHGWADAARRAGIRYYPKLVVAAPFSPVTGQRLLARDDNARRGVLAGLAAAGEPAAGIHVLFDTEAEAASLADAGFFPRTQYQFHWHNDGYRTFDDFLSGFRSDARNKIRRERKALAGLQVAVELSPGPAVLSALHRFYAHTAQQFGPWGHVYLSEAAFLRLGERWGHRLHAVVARDGARIVGGALNVWKGDRLYGRYWGADAAIPFLHFEVCYYRSIAWCIERGLAAFEPGHGGEHKYRRGFSPTITWSSHQLRDARLHGPLARWCAQETTAVRNEVADLRRIGPFGR
jgi:predicted N-acyltransferase